MTTLTPRHLFAAGAALLAIPALGGVAYAAAHAVSDNPAPQRIIPIDSRTHAANDDSTVTTEVRGREAAANDDHGTDAATDPVTSTTTAVHDATDDHGGATAVSDDGANHDAIDDHGGSVASTSTTVVDDHSGSNSGSNSGSGSGSSGGGSDDSGHHGSDG